MVPSEFVAVALRKVSDLSVEVVPLGVDEDFFVRPQISKKIDRPSLLIFGRFDPVKGHREFMKIMARIKCDWPIEFGRSPVLNIVGRPANLSVTHLREACLESGLVWDDDVVVHAGTVDVVPLLLSQQTLGVVSSLGSEYICRVAEEFLLCGTPVIVSGAGSLDEVLVNETFGASYRGADVSEAAHLISQRLRRHFSESVNEKNMRSADAKKIFSLKTMSLNLEAVVNRVLSK